MDEVSIGTHNGVTYIGKSKKSWIGLHQEIFVDTLVDFGVNQKRDLWSMGIRYSRWEPVTSTSGILSIRNSGATPPVQLKMLLEEGAIKRLVVEDDLLKFFRFIQ